MKVVHLSTGINESSACIRLHIALKKEGIESFVLARYVVVDGGESIRKIKLSFRERLVHKFHLIRDKCVLQKYDLLSEMPFSVGMFGANVLKMKEVQEADVVHIHWICDYLSFKMIDELVSSGKVVAWTCHDSWPFTGGCHVRLGCTRYAADCGRCPVLQSIKEQDISRKVIRYKRKYLCNKKITLIAPSSWTRSCVKSSSLFKDNRCEVIPNTIDLKIFSAKTEAEIVSRLKYNRETDKIHIMFGAVSVDNPYKGFEYLEKMLEILDSTDKELAKKIVLHVFGGKHNVCTMSSNFQYVYWGYIDEQEKMANLYSMVDVLIYPSLEESLGYVVMECLACETPVVVFETGGIPDMVEHKKSGYIAKYKDSNDLLNGLLWVINNNRNNCLGIRGRQKIESEFGESIIARKHINMYESLIKESKYED